MSSKVKRLFEQFQPENYALELAPNRDNMTFSGSVTIKGMKRGRPSQRLTFHQNGLNITAAKVIRHDKKGDDQIELSRLNHHRTLDEIRLHSSRLLYPGSYTVKLEFEGKITRPMQGIYPCFFKHKGKDKVLIATQFESHHAREAFPCIDEPEAKATFDLTLITPRDETTLANTPIKSQTITDTLMTTAFETTPKMSTYLLAFVYGEMHAVTGKSKGGVRVSSWATVEQPKEYLDYANKEAIALLGFFEGYFEMPFPLPKLDQVALPDFDSLAMENWGLITFREVGLLADPVNRSISGERLITMVVAHELSHQWFGNLVTMKWWDDLWLNESFASIMESLAPDKLHPDWQEWEDFTSSRVIGAANRDLYKDVQPVGVRVSHPDEILSLFDPAIVYAKGARILKMLFDYIGEDAFRSGLTAYFKQNAYGSTTRDDLWKALSKSSGKNIDSLMTPWIEQSGTPEVSVMSMGRKLKLSQKRFLLDGEDSMSIWPIPLLADVKLKPDILDKRSLEIDSDKLPILNPNGSGHFIVEYKDSKLANNLRKQIINRSLNSSGRIITLSDMLLESKMGKQSLANLLELIDECGQEDRDAVWSMFARIISSTHLFVEDDDKLVASLKTYRLELAKSWYEKLGWEDGEHDDPNTKNLRTTAIALSIGGESQQAINTALELFSKAKSIEALPAEQRGIIAGVAVRFGKKNFAPRLMKEYAASKNSDVKDAIAAALCSTHDEDLANQIVAWGMNDESVIRTQDIDHWFAYMMRNYYTRQVAWGWVTNNWGKIIERFGGGKRMEYFVWYASGPIATRQWQELYRAFFEPMTKDMSLKRNILISLSEIQSRVDWRERDLPGLKKFLKQK